MQKIKKNDPCYCGSGKKYSKCCIDKIPRKKCIYIGGKEPFQGIKLDNGKISLILPSNETIEAEHVFYQTHYISKSGKERRLNFITDCATFDIPIYLYSNFDIICAIDTNTKKINNDLISVASVFECHKEEKEDKKGFLIKKSGNIVFRNCPDNHSEKFSWTKLIDLLNKNQHYKNKKTAIITDHDIDNHTQYNKKKMPLYGDNYLPDNFTILYANSDKKNESILNIVISFCDKDAENVLT